MSWRGRLGAEHRLHNNHPNCRPCGRAREQQLPQPAQGTETSEQKPRPTGLARSWLPGASPWLFLLTYTSLVTEFQPHGTGKGLPWGPPAGLLLSAEPPFQIELWGRAVHCQGADSFAFPRKTPETYPTSVKSTGLRFAFVLGLPGWPPSRVWNQTSLFGLLFSEFRVCPGRPPAPVLCTQSPAVAAPHPFRAPVMPARFGSSLD